MLYKIILNYDENTDEIPFFLNDGIIIVNGERNRINGLINDLGYLFGVIKNGTLDFTVIDNNNRIYDFQLQLDKDNKYYGTCREVNYDNRSFYDGGGTLNVSMEAIDCSISDWGNKRREIESKRKSLDSKSKEIIRRLDFGYTGTLEEIFKWEQQEESDFSKR